MKLKENMRLRREINTLSDSNRWTQTDT